jgi:hypothetical protein
MKLNFFSILTLAMLTVFIITAGRSILSQQGFNRKSILNFLASVCIIIGAMGFFAPSLSSKNLDGLTTSFEWPVGSTNDALRYPDGSIVVPHEPSSRVQIYDRSLHFIRGWSVDTRGGSFKLFPLKKNTFYLFSARGSQKFHYDLNGNMLSSQSYSGSYPENRSSLVRVSIPTPFYLLTFTHPIASWFVGAFGILLRRWVELNVR